LNLILITVQTNFVAAASGTDEIHVTFSTSMLLMAKRAFPARNAQEKPHADIF
jgi:hypothetical protein